MRLSPAIVGVIVAVLLTLAFWFFLYQPKSAEQATIESETVALEQQQAQLRTEILSLRDIEARQVEIRAAIAQLEDYIPGSVAQPRAIRQFQSAADAAGVEITALTFAEPAVPDSTTGAALDTGDPGTALANIGTTMTVEGGYFQIVDFFRRLEVNVPRAVLIESLNLVEAPQPDTFPTLAATWEGQLFAVLPIEEIATTQGAVPQATPTPTPTPTPAAGAAP